MSVSFLQAAAPFPEFVDPHPEPGNEFGHSVVPLSTGNVVITSPYDNAGGDDAGAVYLFNGATGALISTITGASNYDAIGKDGVTALSNGNFVIHSSMWDNADVLDAGAVTWGSGTTGVSGVVSTANSLVGSSEYDQVGGALALQFSGVVALNNGHYLVRSPTWDNGSAGDAGAVTWGSGTTGATGVISAANSLVGSTTSDAVGGDGLKGKVVTLSNGNYVVASFNWHQGAAASVGAVTWGSGTTGVKGAISSTNSLVGSQANDLVGFYGIYQLTNGNYVVCSAAWDNGSTLNAGAITWGSGTAGVSGVISAANSLVGSWTDDQIGDSGVVILPNGHYVAVSPRWNDGAVQNVGAVTWCNGTTGLSGAVTATNSLIGGSEDQLGSKGVKPLSNGHYVISSPLWNNGATADVGAATWCDGTTGRAGAVSAANSLIGGKANDQVSSEGVTALSNGHYLVNSPLWDNAAITNVGAVTWANGTTGTTGVPSATNSLIGTTSNDRVGNAEVTLLSNGHYVISTPFWDNGTAVNAGAVTWGNGVGGVTGSISTSNSLVGSQTNDEVGYVMALSNGHYVVSSVKWDNGIIDDAGAVTWGNGISGTKGVVDAANSLIGSTAYDRVGELIHPLGNGSFVIGSPSWDNGAAVNTGALTWASGVGTTAGMVSAANSFEGRSSNVQVGYSLTVLKNNSYLISSSYFESGVGSLRALTFSGGATGISAPASASNSLISNIYDELGGGGVLLLINGNYVVSSPYWNNFAGAVSFGNGTTGVTGELNASNSVFGLQPNAELEEVVVDNVNGTFFARFTKDGTGRVMVGSQVDGFKSDTSLASLTSNAGTLSPAFNKDTLTYSLSVPGNVTQVTVTPATTDPLATVTVNGAPVASGEASLPVDASISGGSFTIVVTGRDELTTRTYTVNVARPGTLSLASSIFITLSSNVPGGAGITINRTDGTGAVQATLTTTDGSATAPAHYAAQNATAVYFAAGQNQTELIIPISAKATTTTAKIFKVTLSAAGSGAALGAIQTALVAVLPPTGMSETTKPTLTIASPAKNELFQDGAPVVLRGNVKDNIGVKRVEVSQNGGSTFVDAVMDAPGNSSTGFSFYLTPVTGLNSPQIRVTDFKGNVTQVTHPFTQLRTLKVGINGPANSGTVSTGFVPNSQKLVGKSYTVTATPKTGFVFDGWTANDFTGTGISAAATEMPALTFTFTEGLELTAHFIANRFTPVLVGTFDGLVLPADDLPAPNGSIPGTHNVGQIRLTLDTKGSFSGKLAIDGASLTVPGFFDNTGTARFGKERARSLVLKRTGKPDMEIALQLDMTGVSGRITGTVTQKLLGVVQDASQVTADRAHYSSKSKVPAALAGTASKPYALVFPAKAQTPEKGLSTYAQGDGYATMTVKVDGTISISGKLADNTGLTASAPLNKDHGWALFASLYSNKGCFAGMAVVTDADANTEDVTGTDLVWFRPAIVKSQWYPNGWTGGVTVDVFGARHVVPPATPAASFFPGLTASLPNATLQFFDGLLSGPISKDITISTTNGVAPVSGAALTLTKTSGLFNGTFTHTDTTKPAYQGVVVQKGPRRGGWGFFMSRATPVNGLGESGAAQIQAKAVE